MRVNRDFPQNIAERLEVMTVDELKHRLLDEEDEFDQEIAAAVKHFNQEETESDLMSAGIFLATIRQKGLVKGDLDNC